MNHTRKTKIYFSIIILFFIISLVGGQYYYNEYGFSTNGISYEFMKTPNSNMYENYSVSIPNNSIILRLDDAGAWHYDEEVPKIAEDVTSRNLSLVIAVIPANISNDKVFLAYMRELLKNPNIEVAQHGYAHTEEEFKDVNLEQAKELIQQGKEEIIKELKVVPITFVPPYNVYSDETVTALKEENFKAILGDNEEYDTLQQQTGDLIKLGYTTATFNFSTNESIPVNKIIQDCNKSLQEKGYCEIMIHPQDFLTTKSSDSPRVLDLVKYTEFLRLLDELQELKANTITPKNSLVNNYLVMY